MKSNVIFTTQHNNNYFFNRKTNKFALLHPVMAYILKLYNENEDIDRWYKEIKSPLKIDEFGLISQKELEYYYKKFKFFKFNNQIDNLIPQNSLASKLSTEQIEVALANCDSIALEVTERCNLNCKYCTYSENFNWFERRTNKDMDYKNAIAFVDYFINKSETNLNQSYIKELEIGFYGGEPLMNFFLIKKIVRYVKGKELKKTRIVFGMTTNAILLDKYIDFLVENEFSLLISLDGNEKHNSYRVFHNNEPAFDFIKKNVLMLYNKFPDYFKRKVRFNSVFNNKSSISEIITFFKKTFDKIPIITEISTDGIIEEKKVEFLKIYGNYNESFAKERKCFSSEIKENIDSPVSNTIRDFIESTGNSFDTYNSFEQESALMITSTCLPFSFKNFLTVNGKILQCENIDHKYHIGEINDGIIKIDLERVSHKFNEYYAKMKSQCFNCYFQTSCNQCIFYLDIESEKPACGSFTKDYSQYSKYLSNQIQIIEDSSDEYVKILD